MQTTRITTILVLSLLGAIGAAACVQESDTSEESPQEMSENEAAAIATDVFEKGGDLDFEEPIDEALCGLGYESPSPGPGYVLPGEHDPGGPGYGWHGGWANDPQYAAYVKPRDPDPYKEQRHAKQREEARIREENRRHMGGGQTEQRPQEHRRYPGGKQVAPEAPRPPVHTGVGPLNDKARCEDECYATYIDDAAYCRRLPKHQRQPCWEKAAEKMSLCYRDCSRKYPGN